MGPEDSCNVEASASARAQWSDAARIISEAPFAVRTEQEVAERLLEHISLNSTDRWPGPTWQEPVANYLSAKRYQAEVDQVLMKLPVPFCPSSALDKPGSYLAREATGVPVLVVRGDDGIVRGFKNACRHRGMPVADGVGCARAFSCPYHGWTYRLDGSLRHVPHESGFPDLNPSDRGLIELGTWERHGLVFVSLNGSPDQQLHPSLAGFSEVMPKDQALIRTRVRELDANWKLFLESFIEGYHIKPAHRETFFPFGYDNLNLVEAFGPNSRVIFPFRRIEKLRKVAPARRKVSGLLTDVYNLFPNVIIAKLSHHTNVLVLDPISERRTRVITWSVANDAPELSHDERMEKATRDLEFVDQTGQVEDREIVCAIQKSLATRANEFFTFGQFEGAITHFHQSLASALQSR